MIIGALSHKDILSTPHVKRWHMVEVKRSQNIAEHSYLVALIAGKLGSMLRDPLTTQEWVDLYEGSLLHDVSEIKWGDIPTPTKKFFISQGRRYSRMLDVMESMFWNERGAKTTPLATATKRVWALVKLADLVETHVFYRKEGVDSKILLLLLDDVWDHFNEFFKGEPHVASAVGSFVNP